MPNEKTYTVSGKVVDKWGKGITGLTVRVKDKDLGTDEILGTVITDGVGDFTVNYSRSPIKEKFLDKKPDLFVEVMKSNGELVLSTKDRVRKEAGPDEEFVLMLTEDDDPDIVDED